MIPPSLRDDSDLDTLQLQLAGAVVLRYDARINCARVHFAFAIPEQSPDAPLVKVSLLPVCFEML
jgi:hypothetical protein